MKRKRNRSNFCWEVLKVSEMLLVRVSSIQCGSIGTFWYICIYTEIWMYIYIYIYIYMIYTFTYIYKCIYNVCVYIYIYIYIYICIYMYNLNIRTVWNRKTEDYNLFINWSCLHFWAQNCMLTPILYTTLNSNF